MKIECLIVYQQLTYCFLYIYILIILLIKQSSRLGLNRELITLNLNNA